MELLAQSNNMIWKAAVAGAKEAAAILAMAAHLQQQVGGLHVLLCLLLLLLLLLPLVILLRQHQQQPKLKLPPSPFFCVPVLGHILHLHQTSLQSLRDKLGPIFSLHAGSRALIIYITSPALAHEALITNGLFFASRPTTSLTRAILTNNLRNINTSPYGPHWRSLRRNLAQAMLALPRFSAFKPIRHHVLHGMISSILAQASSGDGVVCVYPHLRDAMFQLLLFMCFGFHIPKQARSEVASLTDEIVSLSQRTLEDLYPFLRFFTAKRRQKAHAIHEQQVKLYTALIERHEEMHNLGQLAPGSYLQSLLHTDNASNPLSIDDLVTLCSEFMTVGTDTTVATLEWAMARLVENPSLQQELYDQIHEVMGDKPVEEKDLHQFPYLQAIIKETLRLHPPVHFLLPHSTSRHCRIGGYDIPPNATVMFPLKFMAKDPEIWKDPLKFEPERFLGTNVVDITGSKDMCMMPFGTGRRICPGITMASMHMELFIARLVQAFEWSIPCASSQVDFNEQVVFTVRMANPLRSLVKERLKAADI